MNIKNLLLTLLVLSAIFSSCMKDPESRTINDEIDELTQYLTDNSITTEPTWTGLIYMETDTGEGEKPVLYDTVEIKYKGTLLDGTFLHSSENDGKNLIFYVGSNNIIYGLNQAVQYMNMGSKASLIVPSNLAYGSAKYDKIDAYSSLLYDIELVSIKPGIAVEEFDTTGMTLHTTPSGLQYYIIDQDTSKTQVSAGDLVTLHYTGYLSDGTIFDSSVKRGVSATFQIGVGSLIKGWDEGVLLMRHGDKFRFVMKPGLAYGSSGSFPIIPPNETLTFDIEVLKIE